MRYKGALFGMTAVFLLGEAQAATVFDFTGSVTTTTYGFSSIAAGTPVSGSFTFDPTEANPALSSGAAGVPGSTLIRSMEGFDTATILSDTITDGSFTFESGFAPQGNSSNASYGLDGTLGMSENNAYGTGAYGSGFTLSPARDGSFAYTSDGTPLFQGAGTGYIEYTNVGLLDFTISSMTPVPLPGALMLLATGLCFFPRRGAPGNLPRSR